ncbi:MAG: T9SS type A sorting domain-containing protein [Candidatus Aegiribacteria sp.]
MFTYYLLVTSLLSSILLVPDEYPSIQSAINSAVNGDTVLVAPGTYQENIRFLGKSITVSSQQGQAITTIDGSNPSHPDSGSVVYFIENEDSDAVLTGFTISGGTGTQSGDNRIGGGILIIDSSPMISDNTLTGNSVESVLNAYGGGILATDSCCPLVQANVITLNTSFSIDGNGYGGGLCYNYGAAPVITGNVVNGNTAEIGGGLYGKHESQVEVRNNVICLNHAYYGGGGVGCNPGTVVTLENNVICDNTAETRGGGIYTQFSEVILRNCILWSNSAPLGSQIALGDTGSTSNMLVEFTDLQYAADSILIEPGSVLQWNDGNFDTEPVFQADSISEYQLHLTSPCIDAGNPDPEFFDPEDPINPGFALWPALGTVTNDAGAFGGQGTGYWTGIVDGVPGGTCHVIPVQAWPNPSAESLRIIFYPRESVDVDISIYDTSGRLVLFRKLSDIEPVCHTETLDIGEMPSGLYICVVESFCFSGATGIVVLK